MYELEVIYPTPRHKGRTIRRLSVIIAVFFLLMIGAQQMGGAAKPVSSHEVYGNEVSQRVSVYGVSSKDVLFAARTLWSESERLDERRLIMWSIRNRVESHYWGDSTYTATVLRGSQYSAWGNPAKRSQLMALTYETTESGWRETIDLVVSVIEAPERFNPMPGITHFYSPVSMVPQGGRPEWANGKPAIIIPGASFDRFHFYSTP